MEMVRSVRESLYSSTGISSTLLSLIATLSVTLVALFIALRRRKRLPPGPLAWPVVGNFPSLSGGMPHHVLRSLANQYGGLMYLHLGSVPTIVVSTVAMSKELFQTHDTVFLDRPRTLAFDIITDNYKNVVVASGRYWRQVRRLITSELLTPKRIATYKDARAEEIRNMMEELVEDAKQGTAVNLKSWLFGITSNSMTRMLTNKRYFGKGAASKKEKEDFDVLIARTFELVGAFVISDFVPYLGFVATLQGFRKKLEDLRDFMLDFMGRMFELQSHKQRAKERSSRLQGDDSGTHLPDFVDLLLRTPLEDGDILPDKNLTLVLADLLNAGTETSATAVEWAMAELVCRPDFMRRLQDELDTVIGTEQGPQEADLPKLPFLEAVVKETFRLHPPVAINLPRESSQEFEFRGFKLPKQTRVMLNFYAIHRDPSVYDSPDEFKPERFWNRPDVNHKAAFESYELTPFSAGRRMCPAADLGHMMVSLILAHLAHSFDWSLPEGVASVDMTEQFGLTMSMKTPLRLIAKPRRSASLYT